MRRAPVSLSVLVGQSGKQAGAVSSGSLPVKHQQQESGGTQMSLPPVSVSAAPSAKRRPLLRLSSGQSLGKCLGTV